MAYFAQAGHGQAFVQGGVQHPGAAPEAQYQHYQQHAHPVDQGAAPGYGYADPDGMQEDYSGYDAYGHQPEAAPPGQGGLAKALGMLGAAASLALVAGLGIWGYKLVVRDVSGVPVVRAVEGPMRVQPDNPGGRPADNQGLAVNAVAATGTAEAPADRLTLAPEAIQLTEDDKPAAELAALQAAPEPELPVEPAESAEAAQASDIDALIAELTSGSEAEGETAQPAAAAAIVQPEPLRPVELAAVDAAPRISPAVLNAPGVKLSLRPQVRPARFTPAPAAAPQQARATLEVDPASLPAGTRLAQLGAYESPEVARAEWDRISARFSDYLEGKSRVIQRAQSGGRIFYRLRAMGFDDLSDARRFCSALVAGNADCIPVTTR